MRDLMPTTPFIGGLGIVIERYEPDDITLRVPFRANLTNDGLLPGLTGFNVTTRQIPEITIPLLIRRPAGKKHFTLTEQSCRDHSS